MASLSSNAGRSFHTMTKTAPCEDWYAEDTYRGKRNDPAGPETGTMRVHRGGGWSSAPDRCRSASPSGVIRPNTEARTWAFGLSSNPWERDILNLHTTGRILVVVSLLGAPFASAAETGRIK